jgi:hypothetical protein
MRRREFITLLGKAAALWPLAADAQQHEQMRRVAVLLGGLRFGDASGLAEIKAVEEGLKELGWTRGQNIDLDYHWPGAQTAVAAPVMSIAFFAHRARRSFRYKNPIDSHYQSISRPHVQSVCTWRRLWSRAPTR